MSHYCLQCKSQNLQTAEFDLGVTPMWIARESTADDLFEEAVHAAEEAGYIKKGDRVVLTAGVPLGVSGKTNMIRVVEV